MKLTLKNLEQMLLTKGDKTSLRNEAVEYVIDKWDCYEDKTDIFTDVLYKGCESGIVESLFYYEDTVAFYEKHKTKINFMLYLEIESTGYKVEQLLRNWDITDPLALNVYNQNILAWFGFETMMRTLAEKIEELEDLI